MHVGISVFYIRTWKEMRIEILAVTTMKMAVLWNLVDIG